jgi:hypothetical protein
LSPVSEPQKPSLIDTALAAAIRWYWLHLAIYGVGLAILGIVDLLFFPGWSTFLPMLAWTVLLSVHFMVVKSVTVDEAWVSRRVEHVTDQPWDTGHVYEIRRNPFGRSIYRTEAGRVEPEAGGSAITAGKQRRKRRDIAKD